MTKPQLVLCGSIAIDRIMSFNGRFSNKIQPDKIDVLSVSILIDRLEIAQGGVGANMARAAAQLGLRPHLLGAIGKDGSAYLQELEQYGVQIDHTYISDLPTATFSVVTDADHNQFGGFYPGAMSDADSVTLAPWYESEAIIVVSAHDPDAMRRQVAECHKQQLRLVYDPGQQANNISGADLLAGCQAAEVIIVNDYELGMLVKKTGRSAASLKKLASIFITTHGKEGSTIEGTSLASPLTIKAATPSKVVDPTGAGDSYRVGFLYGLLHDWTIEQCGQLASVVASFNVESPEPVPQLDTQKIIKRYRQEFKKEIQLP